MRRFRFFCIGAEPERYAATPIVQLRLRIEEASGVPVAGLLLRCQIQIQPAARHYSPREQVLLRDLFDVPQRWHQTMRPFQFASVACVVPRFVGETEIDLPVPCTYDFEVAPARYCHVLEDGVIPLLLLFSGTAFLESPDEGFQVEPISWESEASYPLPVAVWREVIETSFPNTGWIRLPRETILALQYFKAERGLATWDETIQTLLGMGRGYHELD